MKFKATEAQVFEIATRAVNASTSRGLGALTHDPLRIFTDSDIRRAFDIHLRRTAGLSLDYVQGRMVKLDISSLGDNVWEIKEDANIEYQSWASRYHDNAALVLSVRGVTLL